VPWFSSDEEKAPETTARDAVRALSIEALAADVLECVFGAIPNGNDVSVNGAFGRYDKARSADLSSEDRPAFAEALQHLQNHRAIALNGFMKGDVLLYFLTRRGRELLDSGEHRSVLAG
jgi:hypothetical protein